MFIFYLLNTISVGQLSVSISGSTPHIRLSSNPGTTVIVFNNQVENWVGGSAYNSASGTVSFTTSDWTTWKQFGTGTMAVGEVNTLYVTCSNEDKAYRFTFWIQGSGSRFNYVIMAERF